jgi:hypothetical protein
MSDAMNHDDLLDLVAVYALGALPPAEALAVSEHLALCAQCRAEYAALRPAADAVAYAAEAPVDELAAARVKAALLRRVRAGARAAVPAERPRRTAPVWPAYLVAAAAIVIALINVLTTAGLRAELAGAHEQAVALQQRNDALLRTEARDREMVADLVSADGKHFAVPGGEVIARGGRLYVAMDRLPQAPPGHVYQAWTLAKSAKTMTPSITFVPNKTGLAVIALPDSATNLVAVAVSVEPDGGSAQPTTKPLFVRTLE